MSEPDFGLTPEEIERFERFSELSMEERINLVDDTYRFMMEVMGEEGRKNFYYLRHKDDYE